MTGGSVDLVYTNNTSLMLSASQGLPITIVSGANLNAPTGKSDMATMIVSKDVGSPRDLAGKTIAVNARNNINWRYTRAWLRAQGVDPDDAKYVEIEFPDQPTALPSGKVKAALMPEPFASTAVAKRARPVGFPYRIGPDHTTFISSFAARPEFAREHADSVRRFRAALADAIDQLKDPANRGKLSAALARHTKMTAQVLDKIALADYTTEISKPLLQDMLRLMEREGMLKRDPPDVGALIFKS